MKIKSNLKIRTIAGESVVLMQGEKGTNMTKIISLNPTSKAIWEEFWGKDFTQEDISAFLLDHYDVEEERAVADTKAWIKQLEDCSVLE